MLYTSCALSTQIHRYVYHSHKILQKLIRWDPSETDFNNRCLKKRQHLHFSVNCSFKSDVFRLYSDHARIHQTEHKRIYQSYKLSHALKLLWINTSPSAFLYLTQTYENTICRCMCLADCHLTFSCAEIDGRNRRSQRDTGSKEKKESEHETLRMLHRNVVKLWNTDYAISHTYFAKLWSALWSEMQIM